MALRIDRLVLVLLATLLVACNSCSEQTGEEEAQVDAAAEERPVLTKPIDALTDADLRAALELLGWSYVMTSTVKSSSTTTTAVTGAQHVGGSERALRLELHRATDGRIDADPSNRRPNEAFEVGARAMLVVRCGDEPRASAEEVLRQLRGKH